MPHENQNFGTAGDEPAGEPNVGGMVLNRVAGLCGGR